MKQIKRIEWIDIAKGYGMIFVILGHMNVGKVGMWIYTFHMPLFFFLSGYVFSIKSNFKDFIKNKINSLIIPYFSLGGVIILFIFFKDILLGKFELIKELKIIVYFLLQRRLWVLWFIACLFWLNIIFYFFIKWKYSDIKKIVISLLIALLGVFYYKLGGKILPWNIDVCFTAFPFFYFGYLYKYYEEKVDKKIIQLNPEIYLFLLLLTNISFAFLSKNLTGKILEMYGMEYGFFPFVYISAFAGIFFIIMIAKQIRYKGINYIKYIGKNTLVYYAWHQTIIIPIIYKVLEKVNINTLLLNKGILGIISYKILVLILVILILTVCNIVITKIKLKFIFGK